MKKLLSIVLVLSMLIGMFSGVSVSAANKLTTLNDYSMDFEDGSSLRNNESNVATDAEVANAQGMKMQLVADPAKEGNTVLKVTLPSELSGSSYNASMLLKTVSGAGGYLAQGTLPAGHRIVYTFRYYLGQEVNATSSNGTTNFAPAFCVNTAGAGFAKPLFTLPTTAGEWHTAVLTYNNTSAEAKSLTQAQLRLCGDNNDGNAEYKNWVVEGHTGYSAAGSDFGERVFYLDDLKVYTEEAPSANKLATLTDYNMTYEYGASTTTSAGQYPNATEQTGNSNIKTQLVADPANDTNTVLKVTLPSDLTGSAFNAALFMRSGTSAANFTTGTVPAGKRLVYTFRYYLGQDVETSTDGYAPEFCIANTIAGATKFARPNVLLGTESGKWHTVALKYDNTTTAAQDITQAHLRFCGANFDGNGEKRNWVAVNRGETAFGERVFYIDDFKTYLEDIPAATNVAALNGYSINFENGTYMTNTAGQYANSTEQTGNQGFKSQLVADPKKPSNTVMKVTLPGELSGAAYDAGLLLRKADKNFATATVPAGSRLVYTFRYYLGQEVETSSTDGANTFYPEFYVNNAGGSVAKPFTTMGTKAGEWHTATLVYANTGAEAKTVTQAQLRFAGHNSDGKATYRNWFAKDRGESTYGERVFYIDDLYVYVEEAPAANSVAALDGYNLSFDYGSYLGNSANKFASAAELANDKNVRIQIVADPEDSANAVMKTTIPSDLSGGSWYSSLSLKDVNKNNITAKLPSGHSIVYTFRYYLGQEVEESTNGVKPAFCVYNIGGGFSTSATDFETEAGKWHTVTLTYTNTTHEAQDITQAQFRFCGDNADGQGEYRNWVAKGYAGCVAEGGAAYGERVFYIDDFSADVVEGPAVLIEGAKMQKVDAGIKVFTENALTDAKLVFVTYNEDGKMEAVDVSTSVSLGEQGIGTYPVPAGFENAKVMLWSDLSTFKPLANTLN